MIPLDFSIPILEPYNKYLIRYQGLDLSFLGVNSQKYLNKWAMPFIARTVNDRELILKYAVPDRKTAQRLSELAMVRANKIESTIHEGRTAIYSCDSVSWDEFSNQIEVTVKLLVESGFIEKQEVNGRSFIPETLRGAATSLDWGIDLNPSTTSNEQIVVCWETIDWDGGIISRFEMRIPSNNGSAISFNTREPEKSTVGGKPLVEAIKTGYILFNGPLLPDVLSEQHANGVKFMVETNLDCTVKWTLWKRYLLP